MAPLSETKYVRIDGLDLVSLTMLINLPVKFNLWFGRTDIQIE
jgi:hypothetical protein